MNTDRLLADLKRHEGKVVRAGRHMPYTDTVGKITIGYGRNLTDTGISEREAEMMLEHDFGRAVQVAMNLVPSWESLNDARQEVLVNMALNLGGARLALFRRFLAAVERGDFREAAAEMRDSTWYRQVKGRGEELAVRMETGI